MVGVGIYLVRRIKVAAIQRRAMSSPGDLTVDDVALMEKLSTRAPVFRQEPVRPPNSPPKIPDRWK